MKSWPALRLALALVTVGGASFAVFPAPKIVFFMLALLGTEFGHWLVLGPLLLLVLRGRRPAHDSLARWLIVGGDIAAIVAAGFFLSSSVRASFAARSLPGDLARVFPQAVGEPVPAWHWRNLWFAAAEPKAAVETHEFARHDGEALQLKLFRSHTPKPAACVIVIHGGGWVNGSADEFPALNHHLAARGYAVAAIEYRLAPRWTWPAQRDDVLDALHFLQQHAGEFGLDAQRFILLGRSAGGQIAEAVAFGVPDPAIRGCIAFYAPADLHFAYRFARADDILNSLQLLRQYLGGSPAEALANYDSASAILHVQPSSPPTLLIHGGRDELVWFRQSERFDARLQENGVPHYFLRLPWATHAFDYTLHGPGGQLSTYAVDHFLRAVVP